MWNRRKLRVPPRDEGEHQDRRLQPWSALSHGKPAWVFLAQVTTHMPIITCSTGGVAQSCSIYQCGLLYVVEIATTPCFCLLAVGVVQAHALLLVAEGASLFCQVAFIVHHQLGMLDLSQISHEKRLILRSHGSTPLFTRTFFFSLTFWQPQTEIGSF